MITLIPVGGLANRMKAIIAGIQLAKELNVKLKIIWFKDRGLNCRFDQLFQPLYIENIVLKEASSLDLLLTDRPRKRNLKLPLLFEYFRYDQYLFEDQVTTLFYAHFDFKSWAAGKNVLLASCINFYPNTTENLFCVFIPLLPLQEEISSITKNFNSFTQGIHIRRTDHLIAIDESPTTSFINKINEELKVNPFINFYLATDSEEEKRELTDTFGKRILTAPSSSDRNSVIGMQNALIELYTLSHTSKIVGSLNSSYSETAAQISGISVEFIKRKRAENAVLVIIVSYNFEPWIIPCLTSLRKSTLPVSVVVIDNCSKDQTVELITNHFPEVRLIQNQQNRGFGMANNQGLQLACAEGYESVFLMNQDAWIEEQTIETLVKTAKDNPLFGICSPIHVAKNGSIDHGFQAYTGVNNLIRAPLNTIVETEFINAAFWLIPLSVLKQVGGFSPLFYHYGEDKDFVNRLRKQGYKVGYSPYAIGFHDREQREVTHASFLHSEKVYLLSEYANINYSFPKAFAYSVLACLKKAAQSATKKSWKNVFAYLAITKWLLIKTPSIIRIRKRVASKGAHFIH